MHSNRLYLQRMFQAFRTFLSIFAFAALAAMAHCVVIEPAMASVHEAHEESCMDVGHGDMCCHAHHVVIPDNNAASEAVDVSAQSILSKNIIPSVGASADIFRAPRG